LINFLSLTAVAAAFTSCRLDYCNSLLYSMPDTLLQKLQSVQNTTAWPITGTRRRAHIALVPRELHVKFRVACLVCQSLFGQVPLYLADDCCLVSDSTRRSLWLADVPTCVVPQTLSSYGDRILQPLNLACGTLFRSSCAIQTSPMDCSDDSWRDTFFGKHEHSTL